jgi:DNA-binding NtrC family response regulator
MKKALVLVADDEEIARENLGYILRKEGHEVVCAESGETALKAIGQFSFDLVMTDFRMKGVDGLQVLDAARRKQPAPEVIVVTGYATVGNAVEAMKRGAFFYVAKPYQIDEVRILVNQALEKHFLRQEVNQLKQQVRSAASQPLIIGTSSRVQALKRSIHQIAPTDCSVVILGETGTGKELVARTIHHLSSRSEGRFLAVNCGAFNEELLANELFGHEREAFTGARGVKKGLLETAQGGTILLDEIAEMPLSMQVKLLRVLQEKRLLRIGGTEEIPMDIRVLAATNKNLKEEVERGAFRHDLYFRLNVMTLIVPPLSERREDIPALCAHFLRKFSRDQGKHIEGLNEAVQAVLNEYEYPGNVRELENILERGIALSRGPVITEEDLPPDLQQQRVLLRRSKGPHEYLTLEENEREYITWVLERVKQNKTRAAEILGIDRVSLWRKLRRYRIED